MPFPQEPIFRLLGPRNISILQAVATGVGIPQDVTQTAKIMIAIIGENDTLGNPAIATIKFRGSPEALPVDITGAAGIDNPWNYVAFNPTTSPSTTVAGGTGEVLGGNGVVLIELVSSKLATVCPEITAWTSGKITVKIYSMNNQ